MKCNKNMFNLSQKAKNELLIIVFMLIWAIFLIITLTNQISIEEQKETKITNDTYCDYLNETHGGNVSNCEQIYVNSSISWNISRNNKSEVF